MLIVDGCQSRLDHGFVSDINNKDHEWDSVLVFRVHCSLVASWRCMGTAWYI
jgi:hypothetical protein